MRTSASLLLLGLGVAALACRAAPPHAQHLNVLLFTLDTTRRDVIGAYGSPVGATPNIDALAQSGVRFDRAYTVTPLTIPAHSSIHTGLYPPHHGVRDNGDYFLDDGAQTLAETLKAAGYHTMASVGAEVTSHHWGFGQGFDAYYDDLGVASARQDRWEVERPGDQVVDDALGWLTADNQTGAPWFAWIHLFDAHAPHQAPGDFARRFPKMPYAGEVAFDDAQVGRVIDALKERGELDNTLIVIVADHGEGLGDHGEMAHGILLYDPTTHIPMILRPPGGLAQERQVEAPTSLVDLMPTVLSVVGVPAPPNLDGIDLSGTFATPEVPPPADRALYLESLYAFHHFGWAPQRGWVDADYKLIDSTTPELYAKDDPREQGDLAQTDPKRLAAMQSALDTWVKGAEADPKLAARAETSGERVSQLAALGYVTGNAQVEDDGNLPDPADKIGTLRFLQKAQEAFRQGDLDEAERLAKRSLADDPGLEPPRSLLIQIAQRQGHLQDAIAQARDLLERDDESTIHAQLGALLLQTGQVQEARQELETALKDDVYLAPAWSAYLQLLYTVGDHEGLKDALARVEKRLPGAPFVLAMQGAVDVERGDVATGEPLLRQALDEDKQAPMAHYFLAVAAERRNDDTTAEKEYLAELRNVPSSVPAHLKLVALYGRTHRWDDELAHLKKLRELTPANPDNTYATGLALFNLHRYDEAEAKTRNCRRSWPQDVNCAVLLANVLAKQGHKDEADAVYAEAKKLVKGD